MINGRKKDLIIRGGINISVKLIEDTVLKIAEIEEAAVFALIVWTCYVVIQLTVRYAPIAERGYLPVPVYVIAACGVIVPGEALASYTAALLLALSTRQMVNAFRKEMRFEEVFRAGFYLGFIPLLYAPGVVLMLLVPILGSLYRRSARELAVGIAGAAIPLTGAWFITWVSGSDAAGLFTEFWRAVSVRQEFPFAGIPVTAYVCAGLLAVLAILAATGFFSGRKGMRTRPRKMMAHALLVLSLTAASIAVPGNSPSLLPLLAVPTALAVPHAFTRKLAVLSTIVYCVLIIAVVSLDLLPLLGI